jgi:hypothetical protein
MKSSNDVRSIVGQYLHMAGEFMQQQETSRSIEHKVTFKKESMVTRL